MTHSPEFPSSHDATCTCLHCCSTWAAFRRLQLSDVHQRDYLSYDPNCPSPAPLSPPLAREHHLMYHFRMELQQDPLHPPRSYPGHPVPHRTIHPHPLDPDYPPPSLPDCGIYFEKYPAQGDPYPSGYDAPHPDFDPSCPDNCCCYNCCLSFSDFSGIPLHRLYDYQLTHLPLPLPGPVLWRGGYLPLDYHWQRKMYYYRKNHPRCEFHHNLIGSHDTASCRALHCHLIRAGLPDPFGPREPIPLPQLDGPQALQQCDLYTAMLRRNHDRATAFPPVPPASAPPDAPAPPTAPAQPAIPAPPAAPAPAPPAAPDPVAAPSIAASIVRMLLLLLFLIAAAWCMPSIFLGAAVFAAVTCCLITVRSLHTASTHLLLYLVTACRSFLAALDTALTSVTHACGYPLPPVPAPPRDPSPSRKKHARTMSPETYTHTKQKKKEKKSVPLNPEPPTPPPPPPAQPRAAPRTPFPLSLALLFTLFSFCIQTSAAVSLAASHSPLLSAPFQALATSSAWGGVIAHNLATTSPPQPLPTSAVSCYFPDGPQSEPPPEIPKHPEYLWKHAQHPSTSPQQHDVFSAMLASHSSSFAYSVADLPGYSGACGPFRIHTTTSEPVIDPSRRYSAAEHEVAHTMTEELISNNIARRVDTANEPVNHISNLVLPLKKDADGNYTQRRFCTDYIPLNKVTQPDHYGLPLPEDLFQRIGTDSFLSKIDLRAGFHQIPIHPDDQTKTSFRLKNEIVCYCRLAMGLRNATAYFCRVMDEEISRASLNGCAFSFVDDVLIHSPTYEQHLIDVAAFLDMLHTVGLRAHPEKSIFCSDSVEFLGHQVNSLGITPHHAKIDAIHSFPTPTDLHSLRAILGFFNYYRTFVPNFSSIAQPLHQLTKKDVPFVWTNTHQTALDTLKAQLCDGRALRRPEPDLPYTLYTDWSKLGLGAVLAQRHPDGVEYMVACISRSLNSAEGNYSSYDGELLAAVWAIKTFRPYLHATRTPFSLVTDNQALTFLKTTYKLSGRHARWQLSLQDYSYTVTHRPGVTNANADVPSRFPRGSAFDGTGARMHGPVETLQPPTITVPIATSNPYHTAANSFTPSAALATFPSAPAAPLDPSPAPLLDNHHPSLLRRLANALWSSAQFFIPNFSSSPVPSSCVSHPSVSTVPGYTPTPGRPSANHSTAPSNPAPINLASLSLNTTPIHPSFFHTALADGVVVLELCGGLCAGLEAALRNGYHIRDYLYCDIDPIARAVAHHRISKLALAYPAQLNASVLDNIFTRMPQDVYSITPDILITNGALSGHQWLVVAGWECQDLSPAGSNLGLSGNRSNSFFPVVNVISQLQSLQPNLPPAYILENSATQHNFNSQHVSVTVTRQLESVLGVPVTLDAAQFGSNAHRLRNYWTNLCPSTPVQTAASLYVYPTPRAVNDILDPPHRTQPVRHPDHPPFYPANTPGKPMCALPTLVAYPNSHSFRDGRPGLLVNADGTLLQPNADERERALGYITGATAAPGITERQRCTVLGRCIDANALQVLLALTRPVALLAPGFPPLAQNFPTAAIKNTGDGTTLNPAQNNLIIKTDGDDHLLTSPTIRSARQNPNDQINAGTHHTHHSALAVTRSRSAPNPAPPLSASGLGGGTSAPAPVTAAPQPSPSMPSPSQISNDPKDIWSDLPVLDFLRTGLLPQDLPSISRRRILKRAQLHFILGDLLFKYLPDGSTRQIPPPSARQTLIQTQHNLTGHFGIERTTQLLATSHWWHGMRRDVAALVSTCPHCQRIRATFNPPSPILHPLPICGLFYRWGVDLTGPLPKSSSGNTYVMICIEHYSKTLIAIAIPDKKPTTTRDVFLIHVISRFGTCAEVTTDDGGEFKKNFATFLYDFHIDHRTTSPNHPQADGLAERAVQTVKRSLSKMISDSSSVSAWDTELLPWVVLGYNCSKQESTGYSPYFILHGTEPLIPPAIAPRFSQPLSFPSPGSTPAELAICEDSLLDRAAAIRHAGIIAGSNLHIAQHQDTLRYAHTRSGSYTPRIHRYAPGDYVYHSIGNANHSLDTSHFDSILRIKSLLPSGNLLLVGRCGRTLSANPIHCAPCHLPNIDPTMDEHLPRPTKQHVCQVCLLPGRFGDMLLCDVCNSGYHYDCVNLPSCPGLDDPPWFCQSCLLANPDPTPAPLPASPSDAMPARRQSLFRSTAQKQAFNTAQQFDGSQVYRKIGSRLDTSTIGTASLRSDPASFDINYPLFNITYPDGSTELDVRLTPITNRQVSAAPFVGTVSATNWTAQPSSQPLTALQQLMPGRWSAPHLSALQLQLHHYHSSSPNLPPLSVSPTPVADVQPLLQFIDFTCMGGIADPFLGPGCIYSALLQAYPHSVIVTNDIDPEVIATLHHSALSPSFYYNLHSLFGLDAIVTRPPFSLLDFVIPLAAPSARVLACFLVPGHYLTAAHPARVLFFSTIASQNRLHIIWTHPRGLAGRRYAWVIIFATAALRAYFAGHSYLPVG